MGWTPISLVSFLDWTSNLSKLRPNHDNCDRSHKIHRKFKIRIRACVWTKILTACSAISGRLFCRALMDLQKPYARRNVSTLRVPVFIRAAFIRAATPWKCDQAVSSHYKGAGPPPVHLGESLACGLRWDMVGHDRAQPGPALVRRSRGEM